MSVFHYIRIDNIQRFLKTIREEGWRIAAYKARTYIKRYRMGEFGSTVSHVPQLSDRGSSLPYLGGFWLEAARKESFHVSSAPSINMKRRKIAMIGDLNLPQCRKYRTEQPFELWQKKDIEYVHAHYQDLPRCVNAMQDATHLMLYRLKNNPIVSMLMYEARRLRLPILYDLDDPLFSISAYETYENMKALPPEMKRHFLNEAPKYLDTMNSSDLITVSTPGLKRHTELYTQRPIYLRRNFADSATLSAGSIAMNAKSEKLDSDVSFRVALASGSQGHEEDFGIIRQDICAFLANGSQRKLMIMGRFDLNCLPAELMSQIEVFEFTTYDKYLENLALADCAIMPLVDDSFNKCKSAVRVLDASATGIPSIVGTVSDMAFVVDNQKTGIVVPPKDSWLHALESLDTDRKATKKMGLQARKELERVWSAKLGCPIIDQEIIDWVIK